MPGFAVILPAAGRSVRFGANKLAASVAGEAVIRRSVRAFLHRDDVSQIIIATSDLDEIRTLLGDELASAPKLRICRGGDHRAQSVQFAMRELPAEVEWIAVHDAARPLVSQALIDRVFHAALEHGAAVPALPVHLTVKQAVGPLPAKVVRTLPRHELFAMQTPQAMRRADLQFAFDNCPIPLEQVTDDVQLIELSGKPVWLVQGEERNLKITTASDLRLAEMFANNE